jgi:hypothetical protein
MGRGGFGPSVTLNALAPPMWKLLIAFIVFAAIALWILTKSGADVDMGGEKHNVEAPHAAEPAKAPAAPGSAAEPAASAASSPAG